jgi:cysteine desulfurase family protein (TIGR01976 family)
MPRQELDTDFVRSHFPGLADGVILADNAGGSVPCTQVIDRVHEYMSTDMVQLGASYPRSARAQERFDAGKAAAARFLGGAADEVVVGASTTSNARVLASSLGAMLEPGDEVVVTDLDHEANIGAWRALEAADIRLVTWKFDPASCRLTREGLERCLSKRTRAVCFTHVSNVVGAIHEVAEFSRVIRDAGALSIVDGVAFAPHRRVNVAELGVDAYLMSTYKTYGPHLGLAWVRGELLDRLPGQNHFFIEDAVGPYKLEPGNANHELCAALPGVLDYYETIDRHHHGGLEESGDPGEILSRVSSLFSAHEERLAEVILDFLRSRNEVSIIGPEQSSAETRVPTIAFTVEGRRASEIPPLIDPGGIGIRWGHFYAHRAIERLELLDQDGVVRISLVHYNTIDEARAIVAALERALNGMR